MEFTDVSTEGIQTNLTVMDASQSGDNPSIRLFSTLTSIFVAMTIGFTMVRAKMISVEKGDTKAMSAFTGNIAFPLLMFKTVVTASLGSVDMGVILACSLGKVCVLLLTWMIAYFTYRPQRSTGQRMLTATVFAYFVVASDDFAVGYPVIDALYGKTLDMSVYIAGNALVGSFFFTPLVMVLFSVSESLVPAADSGDGKSSRSGGCFSIVRDIICSPVITMTILGLVYKIIFNTPTLPHPFSDVIDLLTSGFAITALFLTGTSLRSPELSVWPVVLVTMKVVVCAYLSYLFGGFFVTSGINADTFRNFTFFYGSIPTSSAPLLYAMRFDTGAVGLVATGILFGLLLGAPIMFVLALFLEKANGNMEDVLRIVQVSVSGASVFLGLFFVGAVACMWRRWGFSCPGRSAFFAYACTVVVYEIMMLIVSPVWNDNVCIDYLSSNFWSVATPVVFMIDWLQNASRIMIVTIMFVHARYGYDSFIADSQAPCKQFARVILICLLIGAVVATFVIPSTLVEICGFHTADVPYLWLAGHFAWVCILLVVVVAIFVMATRNRRIAGDALLGDGANQRSSRVEQHKVAENWVCPAPHGPTLVMSILVLLRLLTQVVNSSQSLYARSVDGSYLQMLVFETLLEHGQLAFVVVAFLFDDSFLPQVLSLLPAWVTRKSDVVGMHALATSDKSAKEDEEDISQAVARLPSLSVDLPSRPTSLR